MGLINVVVQDENGIDRSEQVTFPTKILPCLDDTRFSLLRFIDPYGDTLFNRLQIPVVLNDLRLLKTIAGSCDQQDLIQRIERLAEMSQKEPHLYLKFIGD